MVVSPDPQPPPLATTEPSATPTVPTIKARENNTGRDVYEAVARASEERFKIHFIGVEVEKARDAPRLIAAVEGTGGKYYDVRDAQQIDQAYLDIDDIEKETFLVKTLGRQVPWFYPFAFASLLCLAASMALRAIPYFTEIS